jgi:hypothetical protein
MQVGSRQSNEATRNAINKGISTDPGGASSKFAESGLRFLKSWNPGHPINPGKSWTPNYTFSKWVSKNSLP